MPRRSGGRSYSTRPAVRNPPPAPARAPAPAPSPTVQGGGIGSAIADGIGWGVGTAMAHRAVDAVMGPRVFRHETVAAPANAAADVEASKLSGGMPVMNDACSIHSKAFQDCISSNATEISKCQFYLDMLNECRRSGELRV